MYKNRKYAFMRGEKMGQGFRVVFSSPNQFSFQPQSIKKKSEECERKKRGRVQKMAKEMFGS